jgi:hypothetical protein
MKYTIIWQLFLNASDESKAQRILKNISEKLDGNLQVKNIEKYWKIEKMYLVNAVSVVSSDNAKEIVFDVLDICKSIGTRWIVTPPLNIDEITTFHGDSHENTMPGVHSVSFHLENI